MKQYGMTNWQDVISLHELALRNLELAMAELDEAIAKLREARSRLAKARYLRKTG